MVRADNDPARGFVCAAGSYPFPSRTIQTFLANIPGVISFARNDLHACMAPRSKERPGFLHQRAVSVLRRSAQRSTGAKRSAAWNGTIHPGYSTGSVLT